MTSSQLIIEEPMAWWLYAFLIGWIGVIGWFGYEAATIVRLWLTLSRFRKRVKDTSFPLGAMPIGLGKDAVLRAALFLGIIFATWAMISTSFCSFRQLDMLDSSVRLSYEWRLLNREIPLASVQDIDTLSLRHHAFIVRIVTKDGTVYDSTVTHQSAVAADCRRFVEDFRKVWPSPEPTPIGRRGSAVAVHVTQAWLSLIRSSQ